MIDLLQLCMLMTTPQTKKQKVQKGENPASPTDSPLPAPASPNAYASSAHGHPGSNQQAHQSNGHHPLHAVNTTQSMLPAPGQGSSPDDIVFFDHAKRVLTANNAYDDFLKLLDLFSRDVIDARTLIRRAERFLGDGELMTQFKDIMHWDDRVNEKSYGPPGSIRMAPPEALQAAQVDDGQGPSYRKLPDSVRGCCSLFLLLR
jgi:paired amphipathic helix protein Sin3a